MKERLERMIAAIDGDYIKSFIEETKEFKFDDETIVIFAGPDEEDPAGFIGGEEESNGYLFEKMLLKAASKEKFLEALYKSGLNPRITFTPESEYFSTIAHQVKDRMPINFGVYIAVNSQDIEVIKLTKQHYKPQDDIEQTVVLFNIHDEVSEQYIKQLKIEGKINKLYGSSISYFKESLLQWAVEFEKVQRCRLLLQAGADPNISSQMLLKEDEKEEDIRPRIIKRSCKIWELYRSSSPEVLLGLTPTPFHIAMAVGEYEIVKLLLQFGADFTKLDKEVMTRERLHDQQNEKREEKENQTPRFSTPLDYLPPQERNFTLAEKLQLKTTWPLNMRLIVALENFFGELPPFSEEKLDEYFAQHDYSNAGRDLVIGEARRAILLEIIELQKGRADKNLTEIEIKHILKKYCHETSPLFDQFLSEFKDKKLARGVLSKMLPLAFTIISYDSENTFDSNLLTEIMTFNMQASVNADVEAKVLTQFFKPLATFSKEVALNVTQSFKSNNTQTQETKSEELVEANKVSRKRGVETLYQSNSSSSSATSIEIPEIASGVKKQC